MHSSTQGNKWQGSHLCTATASLHLVLFCVAMKSSACHMVNASALLQIASWWVVELYRLLCGCSLVLLWRHILNSMVFSYFVLLRLALFIWSMSGCITQDITLPHPFNPDNKHVASSPRKCAPLQSAPTHQAPSLCTYTSCSLRCATQCPVLDCLYLPGCSTCSRELARLLTDYNYIDNVVWQHETVCSQEHRSQVLWCDAIAPPTHTPQPLS